MQNLSEEPKIQETTFAAEYRGLQHTISSIVGDPQPPCCFCTDQQIWNCSKTGLECCTFTLYYSSYDV